MKRSIKSMLVLGVFAPFFAAAQVNITLHKDVQALVVNGEGLPITIVEQKRFSLPDGKNQLVVRLSKLVQIGSEFEKFKTDPLVISFDGADLDLVISAAREINRESQIKDFKQNPSFRVIDKNGKEVSSVQEILPAGPGFSRDHEKEVAKFNLKRGNADLAQNAPLGASASGATPAKSIRYAPSQNQADISPENALILMKADFLRMSEKEKQMFLSWAVKNESR